MGVFGFQFPSSASLGGQVAQALWDPRPVKVLCALGSAISTILYYILLYLLLQGLLGTSTPNIGTPSENAGWVRRRGLGQLEKKLHFYRLLLKECFS